jgi:hypothetical protein
MLVLIYGPCVIVFLVRCFECHVDRTREFSYEILRLSVRFAYWT